MAYPFRPMTNDIFKRLTRIINNSILTVKHPGPQFVLASKRVKSVSDPNPPSSEENHNYLRT